ncbi:hypothetical protein [Baaleninema sp.]|uniref:hypothetical protein n=1 Tax=Baaleninema sp. TaxID=3101197 RepID=UPI003CFFC19B
MQKADFLMEFLQGEGETGFLEKRFASRSTFWAMLQLFRQRYPSGSLCADLVTIHEGNYIVRATVEVEGVCLASGMAAATSVEAAEDRARERVLLMLDLAETIEPSPTPTPSATSPTPTEGVSSATTTSSASVWPPVSAVASEENESSEPTDDSDLMVQTTLELRRLGWDAERGRLYLEQTYGKRSRQQLTRSELSSFLQYLQAQPTSTP